MSIFKNGIQIPKIVKKLGLGGYAPELKDQSIRVWVNPSLEIHKAFQKTRIGLLKARMKQDELVDEIGKLDVKKDKKEIRGLSDELEASLKELEPLNDEFYDYLSVIWSQHKLEDTHATKEEVVAIAQQSINEENGAFWKWLIQKTQSMIDAHQEQDLKN